MLVGLLILLLPVNNTFLPFNTNLKSQTSNYNLGYSNFQLADSNSYSTSFKEGFETKYEADQKEKQENEDYYIDGIKNLVSSRLKNIEKHHNNELNKGIIENKKKILDMEKQKNKSEKLSNNNSELYKSSNMSNISKTIEKRVFNPSKEEDTNLLLTKEILIDMVNRIEYNYENNNYLKKYIKSRIEEIIDTNNLLDENL